MGMMSIRIDEETEQAIAVLTADGATRSEVVRSALLQAASKRHSELLRAEAERLASDPSDTEEARSVLREMDSLRAW